MLKQPDGLIAIFSSVVDDFTYVCMTEQEALEVGTKEWGEKVGAEKLQRGLEDARLWEANEIEDGLNRWRDACENIAMQHGLEHLREEMDEMDLNAYPIPQSAVEIAESVAADRAEDALSEADVDEQSATRP